MEWKKKIEAADGKTILFTGINAEAVEDDYNEGEIGQRITTLGERLSIEATNIQDALEELSSYGLPTDISEWYVGDDGRISYSRMEDEQGMEVEPEQELYKQWKEGKAKLYSVIYDVFVKIGELHDASTQELEELGFSNI